MTPKKRFLIGGGGALMPVLVSFLAIDIGTALSDESNLSTANIIGISIRYIILFIVGGVVAYLHEDEHKPFKLFELGIAAPALITSLITAQGVVSSPNNTLDSQTTLINLSLISRAYAADEINKEASKTTMLAGSFLSDVLKGVGGGVYRDIKKPVDKKRPAIKEPIETQDSNSEDNSSNQAVNHSETNNQAISNPNLATANTIEEKRILRIKAQTARRQAEAARAKAERLKKAYRESLSIAKQAERQATVAEQRINRLDIENE